MFGYFGYDQSRAILDDLQEGLKRREEDQLHFDREEVARDPDRRGKRGQFDKDL